jgi:hypothetical protein
MKYLTVQRVNGKPVEVPMSPDGSIDVDVLCQLANLPANRTLVLQRPDGSNVVVNRGQKIKVQPRSFFIDAPQHKRGGS